MTSPDGSPAASSGAPIAGGEPGTGRLLRLALGALLALVTAAYFFPSLDGGFVYDDRLLVDVAPATQSIGAAFQHALDPYWAFDNPDAGVQRGVWRPLTSLALAVGRLIDGGEAFGFHVLSLLLHVCATLLVFRLATRVLATRTSAGFGSAATIGGAAAALLFAVHPAQVESVSWISAMNDPLWGVLGLAALLAYDRREQNRPSFAVAPLLFLALVAKEQALVVPLIALALDATAGRRPTARGLALLGVPLALWFGLRVWVFESLDAGLFREAGDFGFQGDRAAAFRLELGGGLLGGLFWPNSPAVFRPIHPVLPEGSAAVSQGMLWLGGAFVALVASFFAKQRAVTLGLLVAGAALSPIVVSPEKAGLFPLSDRYLYMAIPGAAIAVVALAMRLSRFAPVVVAIAGAALAFPVGQEHQGTFADELTFRRAAVEDAPSSPYVRWGAGHVMAAEYVRTQDASLLAEAYIQYLSSLKSGTIYGDGSFVDDASKPQLERLAILENLVLNTPAEQRRPDPTVFYTVEDRFQATLGQIYSNLLRTEVSKDPDFDYPLQLAEQAVKTADWGTRPEMASLLSQIYARRGNLVDAKTWISTAMKRAPGDVGYQQQLADLLMREGEYDGARATLERALEIAPDNEELRLLRITAAIEGKRYGIAETALKELREDGMGRSVRALILSGALESARARPSEALTYLDRALEADPGNGEAHKQRGRAMAQLGDLDGALDGFNQAAFLLPEDFESHYNVASILLGQRPDQGAGRDRFEAWVRAVELPLTRAYALSPRSGQEQLALQKQLRGLFGRNPDKAMSLATMLSKQNRNGLALIWIDIAIENQDVWPEATRSEILADAYYLQGQLATAMRQADAAVNAYRSTILLDGERFGSRYELGELLTQLGSLAEAEPHLKKALELLPDSNVAPEMRQAVASRLRTVLSKIAAQNAAGPPPPPAEGGE